ncbi:hypothetical protein PPSIR1_16190 [Plesiocystis pacifica SIR-1]|uniref:Uncharacterized protein n=1 Tax=Plesiocystis pacifica SIR-1 TaxID=391625 RepID=A6GJ58_9BACT|nr:hypothetical protein [Plesiocystis pacifica]EDM74096.1 hypothetical protein PPSIR1_16190 [Plesiocystis pacifica SIR-1]
MSKLSTGILVALSLILGGLLAADRLIGTPQSRELERRLAELETHSEALDERGQALAAERAQTRERQRALDWSERRPLSASPSRATSRLPQAGPLDAPASGEALMDQERQQAPAPAAPSTEQMQLSLEQVFEDSSDDPSWSRPTEAALRDSFFATLDERSAVATIECSASLCRVESDHDDLASFRGFAEDGLLGDSDSFSWRGPMFTSIVDGEDGGPVTAVTFLAREGEPLPGVAG